MANYVSRDFPPGDYVMTYKVGTDLSDPNLFGTFEFILTAVDPCCTVSSSFTTTPDADSFTYTIIQDS